MMQINNQQDLALLVRKQKVELANIHQPLKYWSKAIAMMFKCLGYHCETLRRPTRWFMCYSSFLMNYETYKTKSFLSEFGDLK
jgi:hypothetical protein